MPRVPDCQSVVRSPRLLACVAAAAFAVAPAAAQIELDDQIVREGTGDRRAALTAMELTPFPVDAWSLLGEWSLEGKEPQQPTPDTLDGKVVLIMTYASWYPPSLRSIPVVARMAEERAEAGLVVIGVHDMEGYEDGVSAARGRGALFPIAKDVDNAFRQALMVDQDPDFYLIDRSGQLRFADIETSSLEQAVDLLLDETREEAETLVSRIADARRQAEILSRRTARINQQADLAQIPQVPFVMPPAEAFAAVRWPQFPRDRTQPSYPGQEQAPRRMMLPRDGYVPSEPTAPGRALVVYFFDRRIPETTQLIPTMEALQRRYTREMTVIGTMTPLIQDNSGQPNRPLPNFDPIEVVKETHRRSGLTHVLVADMGGGVLNSASGNTSGFGGSFSSGGQGLPVYAAVVSSDGTVRWFGDPRTPAFESAVQVVADNDPGVRERKRAEDAHIRANPR